MSEDPTQNLEQKYETQPMLETILRELRAGFERADKRFDALESRIDRVEGLALTTRAEMVELRADFRDFRAEVRERFKEPA